MRLTFFLALLDYVQKTHLAQLLALLLTFRVHVVMTTRCDALGS